MILRELNLADKDKLFEWRNLESIVALSSTRSKVEYNEHNKWFSNVIDSKNILGLIIEEKKGHPIGHLRFNKIDENQAIISIYLIPSSSGKGLGAQAIRESLEIAYRKLGVTLIIAEVRTENKYGQCAFKKSGFIEDKSRKKSGHISFVLINNNLEIKRTKDLYKKLYSTHGDSFKSLNWGSNEGQELRFQVLSEIGNLSKQNILDIGCGLGHLLDWFNNKNLDIEYTGLDLVSSSIKKARNKFPEHEFIVGNIMDKKILKNRSFDYVLASGIFCTYTGGAFEWQKKVIDRIWSLSEKGIAFNSLSTLSRQKESDEYYADPGKVFSYCLKITPFVTLRHDYHPGDFTIFMSRYPR